MATQKDNRLGVKFDIEQPVRGRTFDQVYHCQIYSGSTLVDFPFDSYTGATLEVKTKPTDTHYILKFSTDNGDLTLGVDGKFRLQKTDEEMLIPANTYWYDMYLEKSGEKRDFLYNKFIVNQNVTE